MPDAGTSVLRLDAPDLNTMRRVTARWQDWPGKSVEHLVLTLGAREVVADSVIVGTETDRPFAARYKILCDARWRVRWVEIVAVGSDRAIELASDGIGNWVDSSGIAQPQLANAIDIDISITPFTNTLPIRRLKLRGGQSEEIVVVYVQLPDMNVTTDRQRYTCLAPGQRYRYESVDSNFIREIEVDSDGLVTDYPQMFRRTI